ncbi:MAG: chemotaxis response regulator protein-glutamate methylesterase [Planctomycetes bacterium]|nr:chemotaxis response regulator protein-glutamate methylesterase [Planctomycetota bacterium]
MTFNEPLKILVVDDSLIYRKAVRDVLASIPNVEVVGVAANGVQALEKIESLRPDLLTLDVEMPELDGLSVLKLLAVEHPRVGAIMLSGTNQRGAAITAKALRLGAFDFVVKCASDSATESARLLRRELEPRIEAYAMMRGKSKPDVSPQKSKVCVVRTALPKTVEVVAIGISTGGPAALATLLPTLPADLPAPVLIVQHMPPVFTKSLADDLNRTCRLHVREASNGECASAGDVLIAPGGMQMKVAKTHQGLIIRVTDDPPENNCRPSVDFLYRSLAEQCGENTLAVVMTGMGNDGSLGCRLLKRKGARIIAQDETSCTVFGMPRKPIEEGLADCVTPLNGLTQQIVRLATRRETLCS